VIAPLAVTHTDAARDAARRKSVIVAQKSAEFVFILFICGNSLAFNHQTIAAATFRHFAHEDVLSPAGAPVSMNSQPIRLHQRRSNSTRENAVAVPVPE